MIKTKQNILITGTSSGIGKVLADSLEGENVIYKLSCSEGCNLLALSDIEKFVSKIDDSLDILMLNAGVGEFGRFEEISLDESENIINVNLLGNIRLLKALEKNISKKTKIIFIGSIISKKFMKGAAVYQASKFGLRGLAGGLKSEGEKVYLINPKIINTDFHKNKVLLGKKYPETKIEDILRVVKSILSGDEKRFEIDL